MSGDVKVQTEKEYGPPPRSSIGEPRKKLYKFPHLLFPYRSRYKSPNRQQWWPGSVPRFPDHTHPKRWAPLQELSIAFFAFHANKWAFERNLYETMHTLPLRGAGSFFWRDGSQDAWKRGGRKAGRLKARGIRIPEGGRRVCAREAAEEAHAVAAQDEGASHSNEREGLMTDKRRGVQEKEICSAGGIHIAREQFVFSPKEIFFKYRPFKALVFGCLTVESVCTEGTSAGSGSGFKNAERSGDGRSNSYNYSSIRRGRAALLSVKGGISNTAAFIKGRARVAPPRANLSGWRWQPPRGASRWIFRPAFPSPLNLGFSPAAS